MGKVPLEGFAAKGDAPAPGSRIGNNRCPVIVVGIGASAGGLRSLKKLFAGIVPGNSAAFVLIQHLDPSRENLTIGLLKNETPLEVVEATDGMPVLADRIHVMPASKFLSIRGAKLTLEEPVLCNGLRMPIDHFFCSLGADQGPRGCGIVLSGTGSDGVLGLSEIKAAGGRTLAENPQSAEYPDMPENAIAAGVVDAVLPADAMAQAISAFAEQVAEETGSQPSESPEFDAGLRAILEILRAKVGHDFRCYKPNTLVRRVRRRMTLGKVRTFTDFARFLEGHPEEVSLLQKDLLIGVTEFFRQPQAWEILREKVIAPLVENAQPGSEVRVWVPGCSTGKEAYSLAMLLTEETDRCGKEVAIQIFATDSDTASLAAGRNGTYSEEEIGENVSPERLRRFFMRKDGRYQVIKEIRGLIVFAPQNLTADPPFSKLDLISCRNLLIYLDQEAQRKIVTLFHFALREGGLLFLGTAETVGDREDLFEPVSKKWRIYRRIGVGRPLGIEIPIRPSAGSPFAPERSPLATYTPRASLTSTAQQMLLDRFAPACVMIDRKLQVLYIHGKVDDYLTLPSGELTTRVVDMAREGLRTRLRGAIDRCLETNRSVSVIARVRRGSKSVPVKATASPLRFPREADGLLLIDFEDYRVSAGKSGRKATEESDVHQLEDELKVTREELQSTIEQLEVSNDQLKASNEEVIAANEELQSANEEMETSKEELQSLNEELNTINARLQENVDELEETNNDVVNLLSSTSIATVFLDKELKVRRYTPASTRLFSLIPSDVGRPISDVLRHFTDEALIEDSALVLAELTPIAKEVRAEDGRWYIRRITPYRTQDDRIEGIVVTFADVCELKETEAVLRQRQAELEAARAEAVNEKRRLGVIVDSIADGFFALDREWRFTHVNDAALRHFRKTRDEMVGRTLFEVFPAARGTLYETEYRRAMESGEPVHFEAPSTILDRMMELHAYPGPDNMTILFRDITERNRMAVALREAHERAAWLARFPEENPNPVMRVSAEGTVLYCNPAASKLTGWNCEVSGTLSDPLISLVRRALAEEKEAQEDVQLGDRIYIVWVAPFPADQYANVYGRDITQRKHAEQAVLRAKQEWERTFDAVPDLIAILDDRHRILRANRAMARRLGLAPEECIGKVCYKAVHGLDFPPDFCPHALTLGDGQEHMAEVDEDCLGGHFLVSTTPLTDEQDRHMGSVHVARDITELKQAEQALDRSESRFRLLSEIAGKLLATDNPQGIVNELCRDVMAHIDCQAFFNFLVDEETGRLHLNACAGMPEEEARKIEWLDYGVAVCGCAARDRLPIVAENILETLDPRTELVKSYGIKAYACHPLMIQDRLIGTLSFGTKTRSQFSLEDLAIMRTVTHQVAVSMERMRLIQALEKSQGELEKRVQERTEELARANEALRQLSLKLLSSQEEERRRVAVDIHDTLGSCLSAIKFKVQDVLNRAEETAGLSPESLSALVPVIQEGIEECRRIQMDLRPSLLDDIGLLATFSWFFRRFQTIYSEIRIEQEIDIEERDVPTPLKTVVFRITQEAMNNIAKHSKATLVRLSFRKGRGRMELAIEDNGQGFVLESTSSLGTAQRGLGLTSMRERTEFSGGSLEIKSIRGRGTTLRASWPLAEG